MRDELLEGYLRDALVGEAASLDLEVTPVDVRRRLVHRARRRQINYLAAAAALALLVAGLGAPVVSTVASFLESLRPPAGQAADIASLDAATGDLVVTRLWPDGREEEQARYLGALAAVREAVWDPARSQLTRDAVVRPGPDGQIAIAFKTLGVAVLLEPDGNGSQPWVIGIHPGQLAVTVGLEWAGWSPDGRYVAVVNAGIRVFDQAKRTEQTIPLPSGVRPWRDLLLRDGAEELVWTRDGRVVAERSAGVGTIELGTLDVLAPEPTFRPGLPSEVRVVSGLEIGLAGDGSEPAGWTEGTASVAGLAGGASGSTEAWYVAPPGWSVRGVRRSGDGRGLIVAIANDAGQVGIIAVEGPGEWRAGPSLAGVDALEAPIRAVAPDGRSIVVGSIRPYVVDLAHGTYGRVEPGSLFVRWDTSPTRSLASVPTCETCRTPAPEAATAVVLAAAGTNTPDLVGQRPLVPAANEADAWRERDLAARDAVDVPAGGALMLALPPGACAAAWIVEAVPLNADDRPDAVARVLDTSAAREVPRSGLLAVESPPAGTWAVRIRVRYTGSADAATLLYRVIVAAPLPVPSARPAESTAAPSAAPPTTPSTPRPSARPPSPGSRPDAITTTDVARLAADGTPVGDVVITRRKATGEFQVVAVLANPYGRGIDEGGPWRRTGDPAWSEDGYLAIPVVAESGARPALLVFDVVPADASAEPLVIRDVGGAFAWGPGARIVIPTPDGARVVDAANGREARVANPHGAVDGRVISGWTRDGRLLVAAGTDPCCAGSVGLDGSVEAGRTAAYDPTGVAARGAASPAILVDRGVEGGRVVVVEEGGVRTWWTAPRDETVVDAWWSADGRRIWLLATTAETLELRHLDEPRTASTDWQLGPPGTNPPTTIRLVGLAGSGDSLVVALEGSWGTQVARIDRDPFGALILEDASAGESAPAFAGWATVPGEP